MKYLHDRKKGMIYECRTFLYAQVFICLYCCACKPLCHALHLPQTAFDILLFLANNPEYRTASDIVEFRKIKANLVSVNVDRLVSEGYLIREAAPSDRRKTLLFCTEKAAPIIEKGRALQMHFMDALMTGIDEETKEIIINGLKQMEENLDQLPEEAFTI